MLTFIMTVLSVICIMATTISLVIWKCYKDCKEKSNNTARTTLKTAILCLNVFAITSLIECIVNVIDATTSSRYYNASSSALILSNSIYNMIFIFIVEIIAIILINVLLNMKNKKSIYLNSQFADQSNHLCDYCAFDKLDIQKNTAEEDEIIELLKENPDMIDYVKKMLK